MRATSLRKSSELYLAAVDNLAGGHGKTYEITDAGEANPVLVVVYDGVPEEKVTTGFSFGLSSAHHPEWRFSKPELMISVKSSDHAWPLCMGEIVRNCRDDFLFEYGSVLEFGERVEDDCPMTSFLVF